MFHIHNVTSHKKTIEATRHPFIYLLRLPLHLLQELQQEFVRSDLFQGSVEGYIADAAKKLGGKVTFVDAIHYVKGEGIEKKADDFAAEVAAQIAGAAK